MDINRLIDVIESGEIAVVPTDTVYGIIGDATNEDVVHKIFNIKKRDYKKPLILLVSSIDMLNEYVSSISKLEEKLIDKYWPGKLTILFNKNNKVSDLITSESPFVGIRYPKNQELIELMNKINKPLISTSANISSKDVITSIDLLENEIIKNVSYIYDGGVMGDVSSTIIKVINDKIEIIREGDLVSNIKKEFEGEIK